MRLHDPLDEGEAETEPSVGAGLGAIQLVEVGEDLRDVLRRDPDPLVQDGDVDPLVAAVLLRGARTACFEPDRAAARGELHRVVEHLFESPLDQPLVPRDAREVRFYVGNDVMGSCLRVPLPSQRLDDVADVDGLAARSETTGLHRREVDQELDDPLETRGALQDPSDELLHLVGRDLFASEDLGVSLDRRERSPQLVRDVRQELGFHPLDLAFARHVSQHRYATCHVSLFSSQDRTDDRDRHALTVLLGQEDVVDGSGRVLEDRKRDALAVSVTSGQHLLDRFADRVPRLEPGEQLGLAVESEHLVFGIRGD